MIRVLAIDDDGKALDRLQKRFGREGPEFDFNCCTSIVAAMTATPDVVLLDLELKVTRGVDTVRAAQDAWPFVPIIIVTGHPVNGETDDLLRIGVRREQIFNKVDVATERGWRALLQAIRDAIGSRGDEDRWRKTETLRRAIERRKPWWGRIAWGSVIGIVVAVIGLAVKMGACVPPWQLASHDELAAQIEKLRLADEASHQLLHQRINELLAKTATLEGRLGSGKSPKN